MFSIERAAIEGGGIQYQQLVNGSQFPGYYTLSWITLEESATALLDVQVKPGVLSFKGLHSVTIISYSGADVNPPYYLQKYRHLNHLCFQDQSASSMRYSCNGLLPIVGLNCSDALDCALDGLTLIATSGFEGGSGAHLAVRVWEGGDGETVVDPNRVKGVTVLSSQLTGGNDVLDAANRPVGSWVSLAVGETVILLHPPLHLSGVSIGRKRGVINMTVSPLAIGQPLWRWANDRCGWQTTTERCAIDS